MISLSRDTPTAVDDALALADTAVDDALALADRRESLGRLQPTCPSCASPQVQLVAYIDEKARWRCRKRACRFKFVLEVSADV